MLGLPGDKPGLSGGTLDYPFPCLSALSDGECDMCVPYAPTDTGEWWGTCEYIRQLEPFDDGIVIENLEQKLLFESAYGGLGAWPWASFGSKTASILGDFADFVAEFRDSFDGGSRSIGPGEGVGGGRNLLGAVDDRDYDNSRLLAASGGWGAWGEGLKRRLGSMRVGPSCVGDDGGLAGRGVGRGRGGPDMVVVSPSFMEVVNSNKV